MTYVQEAVDSPFPGFASAPWSDDSLIADSQAQGANVALVHDYLLVMRGAERTFAAMADCWPEAPIYTLLHDSRVTRDRFGDRPVHASALQALRQDQSSFRRLLPLYPLATRTLALRDADVVVSSSSAFAHGVSTRPDAVHVCYCHSPFRYAWHERLKAIAELPRPIRPALKGVLAGIREWDRRVSSKPSRYVANSQLTRRRIQEFYGRDASVIYPPVAVDRFATAEPEDYFLVAGEVTAHKRVELAIEAARKAGVSLRVVGEGPELPRLRALHGEHVQFVGRLSDRGARRHLCSRPRADRAERRGLRYQCG